MYSYGQDFPAQLNTKFEFPDFTLTYSGDTKVAIPAVNENVPPITVFDRLFELQHAGTTQKLTWRSSGILLPLKFTVGESTFQLEDHFKNKSFCITKS